MKPVPTDIECVRNLDKVNLVKLGYGGLGLGSSQFFLMLKLPQKIAFLSKLVKSDWKLIISLR